jgi:hypothetical protein
MQHFSEKKKERESHKTFKGGTQKKCRIPPVAGKQEPMFMRQ